MKTEITKSEYLQIAGLLTIAVKAFQTIQECEKAFIELVDYQQEYSCLDSGHFGDAIFSGSADVDEILRKENIKVKK